MGSVGSNNSEVIRGRYGETYTKIDGSLYGSGDYYQNDDRIVSRENGVFKDVATVLSSTSSMPAIWVSNNERYTLQYDDNKDKPLKTFSVAVKQFEGSNFSKSYRETIKNITVDARSFADVNRVFAKKGSSTVKKR